MASKQKVLRTVIQDDFLTSEQCAWLIRQYEFFNYVMNKKGKPIKKFDSCYPLNLNYSLGEKGTCPRWLSKKINQIGRKENNSVIDWIEIVRWNGPCSGKALHTDDASDETTLSCIIYLNSNYHGGQTYFEDGTIFSPVEGRALFFDGKHHSHGVMNIKEGIRYNVACWLKKAIDDVKKD